MELKEKVMGLLFFCCTASLFAAENNAIKIVSVNSSGTLAGYKEECVMDGIISDQSRWVGTPDKDGDIWIEFKLAKKQTKRARGY